MGYASLEATRLTTPDFSFQGKPPPQSSPFASSHSLPAASRANRHLVNKDLKMEKCYVPASAHREAVLAHIEEHVFAAGLPVPDRWLAKEGPNEALSRANLTIVGRQPPLGRYKAAKYLRRCQTQNARINGKGGKPPRQAYPRGARSHNHRPTTARIRPSSRIPHTAQVEPPSPKKDKHEVSNWNTGKCELRSSARP